jgi:DNA-binding CsgD family transcriptional regulator
LRGRIREMQMLDRLLAGVKSGGSQVLVLRGEVGIGKTALLDYVVEHAAGFTVARAAGMQAEMELPFAGLQQLSRSMLGPLSRLPAPQREALEVALGLRTGPPPDRFLVGVGALGLLAELADEKPLLCVVDDAQWLDRASAQMLGFVARRLLGEGVGLVIAVREPDGDDTFAGLPTLEVRGLEDDDARELLADVIAAPVDDLVIDRLVAEARGNPLALLELPRGASPAELAGGFGVPGAWSLSRSLEESFLRRLADLPEDTRRLLLVAAAEPVGDPQLLFRAAERLGLGVKAAAPAEAAGLIELGSQVRFRHTLVRSAIYRAASLADRQAAHGALAEATDAKVDPDRRAWHRAHAALGPDEEVASELERSAQRARARGGMSAAAAFLERAAALTPEHGDRARRALAAAQANHLAGAPDAALTLLERAAGRPLGELDDALELRLRGRIALDLAHSGDAVPLLLEAARRLADVDPALARDMHLESLYAASIAGRLGPGMRGVAEAARAAPRPPGPPRTVDLLVDGLAMRFTDGYAAGAPILKRALAAFLAEDPHAMDEMSWPWVEMRIGLELFDDESAARIASRRVRWAREAGALAVLPRSLLGLAYIHVFEGQLDAAAALMEEASSIVGATGSRPSSGTSMILAAVQAEDAQLDKMLAEAESEGTANGEGVVLTYVEHARAVFYNGLGRYEAALRAAQQASEQDELGISVWALPELVEAAVRSGRPEVATDALERLSECARAAGNECALGIEAGSRALLSDGSTAEDLYREAIERLEHCRTAFHLARMHLLYGEWLRREQRRVDAREQLRRAERLFAQVGGGPFAARCERELLATGDTARRREDESRDELTPHELRIARMARDGASNQEIASQLFVSRKTVEYHLHKVFVKLAISRREQLRLVLQGDGHEPSAAITEPWSSE